MHIPKRIDIGPLTLNCVDSQSGHTPLLFLHGFPDFYYGWRQQFQFFTEAGFRVIVPDQRGYHHSDKPTGVAKYTLDTLGGDMLALLDTLGLEQVFVIGHDWGGAVAWWLAHHHPQRIKGLVALNMAHPQVFERYLKATPSQQRKSWYMLFFQLPKLPEKLLRRNYFRDFGRNLQQGAKPGAFDERDLHKYMAAWSQPRALTSMLNWYRAAVQTQSKPFPRTPVQPPTRILWGQQDTYLEAPLAEHSLKICAQGTLHTHPEAGHWVQLDASDWVNEQILTFINHCN